MDKVHGTIVKMGRFRTTDNIPFCSSKCDRGTIAKMYADLGFKTGAEIGVRRGRYSELLLKTVPGLTLFLIDPWEKIGNKYTEERQEQFLEMVQKRVAGFNAKIIRKTSMEALRDVEDRSLDFVFIDGDHHYDFVAPDIIFWSKKVKSGGIISVHDYYRTAWNGVVEAVDGYTRSHKIDPWYVTKSTQPTAFWVNK